MRNKKLLNKILQAYTSSMENNFVVVVSGKDYRITDALKAYEDFKSIITKNRKKNVKFNVEQVNKIITLNITVSDYNELETA